MWFAGIDWADQHHDVVVLDGGGRQVASARVAHNVEGLAQLSALLQGLVAPDGQLEHVVCLVETTQGLLITALLEAGLRVYPVNPKSVDGLRPPSGAKTDALDALLLARKGRSDWPNLRMLRPDTPLLQELKTLTRDLTSLLAEQTRLVNQLTACLKAYYPGALTCFDGLTRHVTQVFLARFPTPERAQVAAVEEFTQLLRDAHYPQPQHKAQALWEQFHRPQLQAAPGVARAKQRLMLALLAQLQLVGEQIAAYDQAIGELCTQHADSALFASLPGAGQRLAPRLLAEWGDDRTRYGSAASVQALAGTAPVLLQSGTWRRVRRRTACVNPLRQTLYHLARESVLCDDWAKAYYRRKRQEGKTHAAALRALANHWVRILYAMWRDHTPYDPAIFAAAQHVHADHAPNTAESA
jgi:transposase